MNTGLAVGTRVLISSMTLDADFWLRPVKRIWVGACFESSRMVALPRPAVPGFV